MKRPNRDPDREDRIHNEVIADANGPEEQVMGWHCYLDDKVRFAFQAKCITARIVSPLKNGETVEALRTALEDACVATTGQILPYARTLSGVTRPGSAGGRFGTQSAGSLRIETFEGSRLCD